MPDSPLPDDTIEQQGFQLLQDVRRLDFCVLDFLLDVFFFIGQVFVNIGVTLNVGLLLQQIQCGLEFLALGR